MEIKKLIKANTSYTSDSFLSPVYTDADYKVQPQDGCIFVDSSSNVVNIIIPSATQALWDNGRKLTIVDVTGSSATNAITVDTDNASVINGFNTYTIQKNHEAVEILKYDKFWTITNQVYSPTLTNIEAKWFNADVTTDINVSLLNTFPDDIPIFGTVDTIVGNTAFTLVSSTEITCNIEGIYDCIINLHTKGLTRTNILYCYKVNNTRVGEIGSSGYTRNTSGSNEASSTLPTRLKLNIGDSIKVGAMREANGGVVTMAIAGSSSIHIKKIN